uniref:Spermatogenesis-associated protein 13 n=1 Tax=Cacopsylla melanoneura TaxID=428564 RepID=A0A8D8WJH6_9HEMI
MCDPLHNRELWRHSWHYSPFNVDTNWDNAETMNTSFKVPETKDKPNKNRPRSHSTAIDAWPGGLSAPHSTRTAPATPIRDLLNGSASTSEDNLPGGISKSSSTPLLDDPNPSWEWSQMNKAHDERIAPLLEAANQRHFSGYNVTESVLQKFRKSFSLRFYKKSSSNSSASSQPEPPHPTSKQYETQHSNDFEPPDSPPHTDQKFRFGPLIWRSSKERRKGKKASRNQKCNSGDSGIQIEMVGRGTGDSSESHDTDHLADEEILDDTDSPLVVRRRGPGLIYGSEGKASRPTSDVINQVLIDKLKTELQSRGLPRRHGQAVRRTHSDLGGQRLFHWDVCHSYRKMMSSPSPVKMRNQEYTSSGGESQAKTKKIRPHHTLRRSVSQPLGLNELSPLLRRKPIGSRTSNTLSDDDKPPSGNQGQTGSVCSDDELLSDSESSVTSLGDRKRGCGMDDDFVVLAEAVWDHIAMEPEELGFRAGDVIEVLDTMDRDWWWGTRGEASGWFPAAFVRLRVSQEDTVEDCLAALASGGSKTLRRRTSISLLSNDQVRSRVVRELINTERDFVKVLHDVSEGYLAECRRRSDMFSSEQIQTIFGNLEHILAFQSIFLEDLETKLDWEAPYKSCIGETFLKHKSGFRMYSEYCNSHPMAIATLQELYQHNNYSKFFEACRLMRGLIEIPLDGYLLTPVQRICKYPLQLAELLKYTKTDHPDYVKITEALEAMRDVAMLINERKRRMESLEKLAAWQQRVEGWEGEDLIETSSQLIHQGEVIRVTSGMWTNSITLFLFDHQLVYCKRDILKRNTHVYKARLNIDTSQIINLPDGKGKRSSSQVSPNATMTPRSHSLGRRVGTWFNFGANKKNRTFTRAATLQTVVHPS